MKIWDKLTSKGHKLSNKTPKAVPRTSASNPSLLGKRFSVQNIEHITMKYKDYKDDKPIRTKYKQSYK